MQSMLASLTRQHVGAAYTIKNVRNLDQYITRVAVGLLQITRELKPQSADPSLRESRREREVSGFGRDEFLTVVIDGVIRDRAGGIEKDVVRSPVARRVDPQRKLLARRQVEIELAIRGVTDLRRRILSS